MGNVESGMGNGMFDFSQLIHLIVSRCVVRFAAFQLRFAVGLAHMTRLPPALREKM